ncbi:MAG: TonB-dependent receptor [Verrucomicrobia bacterium]|nr:TonB-dependent receptor [Verrucomicrobiota bacterium]
MEKPSGILHEHQTISYPSSSASFLGWPKIGGVLTAVLLGLILAAGASAQQVASLNPTDSDKEPISKAVQPLPAPSLDLSKIIDLTIDYSFLARENLPNSQSAYGRIGEQQIGVRANLSLPINEQWSLSVGGFYNNFLFDLGNPNPFPRIPLVDNLGTLGATFGFVYKASPRFSILAEVSPDFSGDLNRLTTRDFQIGGMFAVRYAPYGDDRLFFLLGVRAKSDAQLVVFPVAGVHWQPSDVLTINLTAPRPEIDYKLTRRITLFADGQFNGGDFRVPDSTGAAIGRPQFNNAVLTYREIRLGGGVRVKLLPFAAVQTEAGEALGRDFDYYRIHENLKANNAPYMDTRVMFSF